MASIRVREERPADAAAVRTINRRAFDTESEADIVDRLRDNCRERIACVAEVDGEPVGYILFTPAVAHAGARSVVGMGLAPLAVLPEYQGKGVGSALVRRGVEAVRNAGHPFIVVLGHPAYYPRFGFERASLHGLRCEYAGVPDEAFMILMLRPDTAGAMAGEVKYRPEFAAAVAADDAATPNGVIIQQDVYERIRDVFDAAPLSYHVFPVSDPMAMAEEQQRGGASCFVIGAERYPEEFYRAIDPHSLIIRYGVGYDHVPVALCRERGVRVAYTPGTLDQSVAEHAVALMLACARSVPQQDRSVRAGKWTSLSGSELAGTTAAILGFGRIGRRVAQILKAAFGMRIVAMDVFPQLDEQGMELADLYTTDFAEAVADADYISLHMGVTAATRGFLNRERLATMKPSAFLVNTARGALVNEQDLYDAVREGRIAGAGLDVFVDEPYVPAAGKDLRDLPQIIMTAHCGSNTRQSNRKMAEACIRNALAWYGKEYDRLSLVPEMR